MRTPLLKHFFIRAAAVGVAVAAAVVATPALAAGWYMQSSGSSGFFKGMDFYTSDKGIAVGLSSVVQRTLNGGNTWTAATLPAGLPSTNFFGVEAVAGTDIAYVVGSNGTILRTADGKTFVQQTSGVSGILYDVACNSTGVTCVAVGEGGTILKTTNSGTTWTPQVSKTTNRLGGVSAANLSGTMTMYAVGLSGTIVKSTDSGSTWFLQTSGVSTELMSVSFYDASNGLAVGTARTILITANGGTSWTPMSTTVVPAHYIFYDVALKSSTEAIIGSDLGNVLLLTTIGTWTPLTMPNTSNYEAVYYGATTEQFAAGGSGSIARYDNITPAAPSGLHFVSPANNTTSDNTPTFTWTASSGDGESGLTGYQFQVNGVMTPLGLVTTHTVSPTLANGNYTAFVRSIDGASNISANTSYSFTVDATPPTVGSVSPTTATAGVPVAFVVTASDNINVNTCTLRVDGADAGAMTALGGGSFSATYTFASAGGHAVAAACADNADTLVVGAAVSVAVATGTTPPPTTPPPTTPPPTTPPPTTPPPTTPPPTTPPPTTAVPGALLKFACASGAAVDHPCKAVYYYGEDGKRHAFPNDKVYHTWYADFSGVVTVTQTFLSTLPLGKNVTYRPGIKLVKFQTLNTVYAVSRGGVLRAVASEAVASALYGSTWARSVDDISDAFFVNYTFGASINSGSDYSPSAEAAAVTSVGANF